MKIILLFLVFFIYLFISIGFLSITIIMKIERNFFLRESLIDVTWYSRVTTWNRSMGRTRRPCLLPARKMAVKRVIYLLLSRFSFVKQGINIFSCRMFRALVNVRIKGIHYLVPENFFGRHFTLKICKSYLEWKGFGTTWWSYYDERNTSHATHKPVPLRPLFHRSLLVPLIVKDQLPVIIPIVISFLRFSFS